MMVQVTQSHIKRGWIQSCASCPVALAVRDTLNCSAFDEVSALMTEILLKTDRGNYYYKTTNKARSFMHKFDSGGDVKPFAFKLIRLHTNDT